MKRFFNYSILLLTLAASSLAGPLTAQERGRSRPSRPQTTRAKPSPTPTPAPLPTPPPVTIAETPLAPGARARFDVTNYRVEVELTPGQNFLAASGDVTFTPLDNTRTVVFELNGSLKIESIERNVKPLTNFVQDQAGLDNIGPHVRIDLGEVIAAGQQQTLRFRWSGALVTPEGGPLATKRLAYVGSDVSYLLYAARWFPFHEYAADRATSEFTLTVPTGYEVAGASDEPVTAQPRAAGKQSFRFVQRQPALVGNFAAARFITRTLKMSGYELSFYVQPGNERMIEPYAQLVGEALQFYTQNTGSSRSATASSPRSLTPRASTPTPRPASSFSRRASLARVARLRSTKGSCARLLFSGGD